MTFDSQSWAITTFWYSFDKYLHQSNRWKSGRTRQSNLKYTKTTLKLINVMSYRRRCTFMLTSPLDSVVQCLVVGILPVPRPVHMKLTRPHHWLGVGSGQREYTRIINCISASLGKRFMYSNKFLLSIHLEFFLFSVEYHSSRENHQY